MRLDSICRCSAALTACTSNRTQAATLNAEILLLRQATHHIEPDAQQLRQIIGRQASASNRFSVGLLPQHLLLPDLPLHITTRMVAFKSSSLDH
jgi:hypothetical protein